jgi:hypothetical protein
MIDAFPSIFSAILRIEGYDRLIVKWWWVGLAILSLMILLASWRLTVQVILWWEKPRSKPKGLLRQLVRVHRLSSKERALISRLAPLLPRGVPVAILFADPSSWAWNQIKEPTVLDSMEKLYVKIFGFPRDRSGS